MALKFKIIFFIAIYCSLLCLNACTPKSTKAPEVSKPSEHPETDQQSMWYQAKGVWYKTLTPEEAKGFKQDGVASWYGEDFHGRKTSNGEIYDMYGVSAAHKTLPFDTYVRIYNLENEKTLDVRINDRGPFVVGRIIDLSYGAAKALGIVGSGTANVKIVALGIAKRTETAYGSVRSYIPIDYYKGNFTIQVGAFSSRENAEKLRSELDRAYKNAHVAEYKRGNEILYRVLVGKRSTLESAEKDELYLREHGFESAFVVAE